MPIRPPGNVELMPTVVARRKLLSNRNCDQGLERDAGFAFRVHASVEVELRSESDDDDDDDDEDDDDDDDKDEVNRCGPGGCSYVSSARKRQSAPTTSAYEFSIPNFEFKCWPTSTDPSVNCKHARMRGGPTSVWSIRAAVRMRASGAKTSKGSNASNRPLDLLVRLRL